MANEDFSLIHEIRGRLHHIEQPFTTIAGVDATGTAIGGVDLFYMRERLSREAFVSYLEACQYLRELQKAEKAMDDLRKKAGFQALPLTVESRLEPEVDEAGIDPPRQK
jgi:hypothetical protein